MAIPCAKRSSEKKGKALYVLKSILASLAVSLAFAAPVFAQTNAVSEQYAHCSNAQGNVACIQSVEGGFKVIVKNAKKSAEASGAALTDSGDANSSDADTAGNTAGKTDSVEKGSSVAKAAGIERLPDTGGASLLIPGIGLLLIATGLFRSRIVR